MTAPVYVVVSPVRDEEAFLENTIRSMVGQTIPPAEWVIVDDGSKDRTVEIVKHYCKEHSWIRLVTRDDRGYRERGRGVVQAFKEGLGQIESPDYMYIVKLDGDVSFEAHYFQTIFHKFAENPKLGIASGMLSKLEPKGLSFAWCDSSRYMPLGAVKTYRRACYKAIGGLREMMDWDTYDVVKAQMLGWETATYEGLPVTHYREMGSLDGGLNKQKRWGEAKYFLGYHPVYILASGMLRIGRKPFFVGSMAMWYAYFKSWVRHSNRIEDPEFVRFLRTQQMNRLMRKN